MNWPDPQRPGEPAESSRPWHWVTRGEDGGLHPLPLGWNPHLRHWVAWDGATVSPEEAARRYGYIGPALTPLEVNARVVEALAAASPAEPPLERADEPPRGLAALAASALPPPPPKMVYKNKAVMMHVLIFLGTLFGTLFLLDQFGRLH